MKLTSLFSDYINRYPSIDLVRGCFEMSELLIHSFITSPVPVMENCI